jgi:hypothetical protein
LEQSFFNSEQHQLKIPTAHGLASLRKLRFKRSSQFIASFPSVASSGHRLLDSFFLDNHTKV